MRWKIRKERLYDYEHKQWTHHFGWILYFGSRRVATYREWERCIRHIQTYYRRFGDTH
jgi:hypothetical protein